MTRHPAYDYDLSNGEDLPEPKIRLTTDCGRWHADHMLPDHCTHSDIEACEFECPFRGGVRVRLAS